MNHKLIFTTSNGKSFAISKVQMVHKIVDAGTFLSYDIILQNKEKVEVSLKKSEENRVALENNRSELLTMLENFEQIALETKTYKIEIELPK